MMSSSSGGGLETVTRRSRSNRVPTVVATVALARHRKRCAGPGEGIMSGTDPFEVEVGAVAVVRAMWAAYSDGRMDAVVATMHPDIEWRPSVRPGRSVYHGFDDIRRMPADSERAVGSYVLHVDSITSLDD